MNKEHVFPQSIGGSFWFYQPCVACNSRLGSSVDSLLTDHPLVKMRRARFGIEGQKGAIPDLFTHGTLDRSSYAGPDVVRVRKTIDSASGEWRASIIPTFSTLVGENNVKTISGIFDDEVAAMKWFKKELARQNLAPATPDEFETVWQSSLIRGTIDNPQVQFNVQIDLYRYRHAIIKIAYEMAWQWLGDRWLQDAIARKIRKVLRSEPKVGTIKLHGEISVGSTEFFDRMVPWMGLQDHEHSATLFVVDDKAAIIITVFNIFFAALTVTENATLYGRVDARATPAPVLLLNAASGTHRMLDLSAMFARGRSDATGAVEDLTPRSSMPSQE